MKYLGMMFSRGIPAYFWLGVLYAIFVGFVAATAPEGAPAQAQAPEAVQEAGQQVAEAVEAATETTAAVSDGAEETAARGANCKEDPSQLYCMVEKELTEPLFTLPLFSSNQFAVTFTVVFIVLGFLSAWIEVVRATNIRSTARNDTWSLIVTLIAFGLFVGVSSFGTTAFLIVAVVGFGDVLLDRYVGQAVARRDFGFPAHGAGGGGGGG